MQTTISRITKSKSYYKSVARLFNISTIKLAEITAVYGLINVF